MNMTGKQHFPAVLQAVLYFICNKQAFIYIVGLMIEPMKIINITLMLSVIVLFGCSTREKKPNERQPRIRRLTK